MLKKLLPKLVYLVIMFVLGFVIYYYFLGPNNILRSTEITNSELPTQSLFSAKLPNEDGVSQDLSQYKGKVIVLNFWATWCPPCREEMPELSALYNEYQSKNVVVLGIAIDELSLMKTFTTETPVSYPLFAAEEEGMGIGSSLGNDKGVLPYTVIINSEGKIVKTFFGRITKPLLETTLKQL